MLNRVRRIVTGHNEKGEAVIIEDREAPNFTFTGGKEGYYWSDLWALDSIPASNEGDKDEGDRPIVLQPPKGGLVFRTVDIPPDTVRFGENVDQAPDTSNVAGGDAYAAGKSGRHPGMHKTQSVDFAIVLSGEIVAMMEVGETVMRPGDVLIQRGTVHAWSNQTNEPCRIAFVLIDADNLD